MRFLIGPDAGAGGAAGTRGRRWRGAAHAEPRADVRCDQWRRRAETPPPAGVTAVCGRLLFRSKHWRRHLKVLGRRRDRETRTAPELARACCACCSRGGARQAAAHLLTSTPPPAPRGAALGHAVRAEPRGPRKRRQRRAAAQSVWGGRSHTGATPAGALSRDSSHLRRAQELAAGPAPAHMAAPAPHAVRAAAGGARRGARRLGVSHGVPRRVRACLACGARRGGAVVARRPKQAARAEIG